MIETPVTSLVFKHDRMRMLIDMMKKLNVGGPFFQNTSLGMFGAESAKPITLMSSESWVSKLYRKRDRTFNSEGNTVYSIDANGNSRYTAGPKLKGTQTYPAGFGTEVCRLYLENKKKLTVDADDLDTDSDDDPVTADLWEDARLEALASAVGFDPTKMPAALSNSMK